ncbi:MAG: NYN domain-containing protein [Bacteroidota bacterium]|jgi:uncharacterized LabA/DUF88 family protein
MKTAILLDGHFSRIHLRSLTKKNATRKRLDALAEASLIDGEMSSGIYYYDCSPYSEILNLPISNTPHDFSKDPNYYMAKRMQGKLRADQHFHLRRGQLSFDGWALRPECLEELKNKPRRLVDEDFEPRIRQKQVDLLIGIDMAKLAIKKEVERMVLVTSDSDLVPAIKYAQTRGVKVFLITSDRAKAILKQSCQRRHVDLDKLKRLLPDDFPIEVVLPDAPQSSQAIPPIQ